MLASGRVIILAELAAAAGGQGTAGEGGHEGGSVERGQSDDLA